MVDFFLSYLKNEKRLSPHTVLAYKTDLRQFQNFLVEKTLETELSKVSYADIRMWVVYLAEQKNDHSTINRKIASVKAFYKYLVIKKHIETDPATLLKSLKNKKKLPVYLEEKPVENLFELVQFSNDFEGCRDKLILELFYGTGIRLAELIGIKTQDVDLIGQKITVLGKRSKYRIIPISNILIELLNDYLQKKQKEFVNSIDYLIVTDKNTKAYPVFIQRKVKHYLDFVTTISKKSPHILRHTFATHLLNRGADLNAIKELLGHSSLVATQIYTHNSINKLKDIHTKAHPKA